MTLVGKGIVVTGASHGFGRAVAEACVRNGANVLLCAREPVALERCRSELAAVAPEGVVVAATPADVSVPSDVERLAEIARRDLGAVDGLINNAGVYGPKGKIEDVSWEDWKQALEVNLYGTVLPCRAFLPLLRARPRGKIVNLSGGGATSPLPHLSAYASSKAAVVRFTETLAMELDGTTIDVNAVAPGALNTRLLEEVLTAGPAAVGQAFYDRALRQKAEGGAPIDKGVDLVLFLLSSASDGITGRLISAIWDPWRRFEELKADLSSTDIYTLRRIVPTDRNRDWEQS